MLSFDAAVIGAGVMGSATAYQLARAGAKALLLEQFPLGHRRGSSHGHSRIIRYAYDHPVYVRLVGAAFRLWDEFGREVEEPLVFPAGGLDLGRAGHPVLAQIRSSLRQGGVGFAELDEKDLARRFPQFRSPPGWQAIYQPDAGIIPASRAVELLVSRARFHGAQVRDRTPVTAIGIRDGRVQVETARGKVTASHLVIAAGSWSAGLLRGLGLDLPLRPMRQQVHFFQPGSPEAYEPGRFPVFIAWGDDRPGSATFYGLPIFGLEGIKVAQHGCGSWIDPQDEDHVDPGQTAKVVAFVRRFLPGAAGEAIYSGTCRYTMTPDEHFVVDRHPDLANVFIAAGFSGHGFKFGILVGEVLARMVQGLPVEYDLSLFRLERLRQPSVSQERFAPPPTPAP